MEKKEIILSTSYYPHEVIVLEVDAISDMLTPTFVRCVDLKPVVGRKIDVEVVSNGYIVRNKKEAKLSLTDDYGTRLDRIMTQMLQEEYEYERPLTESEIVDEDLIEAVSEMNSQ